VAELATLDRGREAQLRALERETGAWLVAFVPPWRGAQEAAPGFASRLTPAPLDEESVRRLQDLERRAGLRVVAYTPAPGPAPTA
jgi:hypothetical protein